MATVLRWVKASKEAFPRVVPIPLSPLPLSPPSVFMLHNEKRRRNNENGGGVTLGDT